MSERTNRDYDPYCCTVHFVESLLIILWMFLNDFSREQRSSLRIILGSKHVGAILSVLMWNFMYVHLLVDKVIMMRRAIIMIQ
jgi:hypothetical protein